MDDEDNMTWTMPWATTDGPVASSSSALPSNQQQPATSAANNIPKKKSVRRSSILKTTTSATTQGDKRGPLKDIGNGRGEPADEMGTDGMKPPTGGKLSTKRRSSLGRRVSFSATTKVKEFEPTNLGGTVWNSTYEASETSTRTQAMEMTIDNQQVAGAAKENSDPIGGDPFAALFASTAIKTWGQKEDTPDDAVADLTMPHDSSGMNLTCKPNKTHTSESTERMDMTCKVSFGIRSDTPGIGQNVVDETSHGYGMMDMTCKPDRTQTYPKNQDQLEMTKGMDMTCNTDKVNPNQEEPDLTKRMDMTCNPNIIDTHLKEPELTKGMDFTCNPEKAYQSHAEPEMTKRMDLTCNPDKINPCQEEPEMTKRMDLTCNPEKVNPHREELEVTRRMDITCNPDTVHPRLEEPELTKRMDLTCKPEKFHVHQVEPEISKRMDLTCNPDKVHPNHEEPKSTKRMDMTCDQDKIDLHQEEPELTKRMDLTCNPDKVHPNQEEPELTKRMDITCNPGMDMTFQPEKIEVLHGRDEPVITESIDTNFRSQRVEVYSESVQPEITERMEMTCKPDKTQIQQRTDKTTLTGGSNTSYKTNNVQTHPSNQDITGGIENAGKQDSQVLSNKDEPKLTDQMDHLTSNAGHSDVDTKAETEVTERMDLTHKPDIIQRPNTTEKVEPEQTERMDMTCRAQPFCRDTVESRDADFPQTIVQASREKTADEFQEGKDSVLPSKIITEATESQTGQNNQTFKIADKKPENFEPADATFKLPDSSSKVPMSTTFTVETKFDDPVTPIRPLQRKGFVEDADTMAFSAAMLSSTRIMNSTAFSPGGGLVSITYDDDEPLASPKVVQKTMSPQHQQKGLTPIRKVGASAPTVNSPLTLPRTEAELKLDMLLNELKTDFPSNHYLIGPKRGEEEQFITDRIQGMFSDVRFTQVDEDFKVQPLQVRKRLHETEPIDAVTPKKKKEAADPKKAVERVSAFEHLAAKHSQTDVLDYYDRHQGAWTLTENHGSYACIAFMQGSLCLNMVVGHRLQSEELKYNGKTILVQHYNIQSLELRSKLVQGGSDNVVRLAHHLLLAAITPTKLGEMCPNTRALEKTIRHLMAKVHEASMMVIDLDRIDNTHCYFKVSDDFRVTVKFYSIKCGFSFKTTLSVKDGFGACREKGVEYERGPSKNSLMGKDVVQTLFKRTDVGWKMMTKFFDKIDAYIAQLEKDV